MKAYHHYNPTKEPRSTYERPDAELKQKGVGLLNNPGSGKIPLLFLIDLKVFPVLATIYSRPALEAKH